MQFNTDNMGVDGDFDTLDYAYAHTPASANGALLYGERILWCAVILQAFFDLGAFRTFVTGAVQDPMSNADPKSEEAARWLLRDNRHFPYVCELAGVSPDVIRRAAFAFWNRRAPGAATAAHPL